MNNICYSGGADGADKAWGEAAIENGHRLIHYVFKNHKGSNGPHATVLDLEALKEADPWLAKANKILKRSWPAHSEFVSNLLRRNYWQIRDTESLYAIADIDGESVNGGTAWAVEMFKLRYPNNDKLYVYDKVSDGWYQWVTPGSEFIIRMPTAEKVWWRFIEYPPTPSGKWTGIGSRELTKAAQNAINELFS